MKKTLVVAAVVVASIMPALPAGASDMMKTDAKAEAIPPYCYFLPLLPKCLDAWKAEMGTMKMPEMKMPMMGTKK